MIENGTVTVFCHSQSEEAFVNCGSHTAWIYQRRRIRNSGIGVCNDDKLDVRIAIDKIDGINAGDCLYIGKTEKRTAEVSECQRISKVTKCDFGVSPHWHIEAEYIYR